YLSNYFKSRYFFIFLLKHTRAPLFPYTTLFRSEGLRARHLVDEVEVDVEKVRLALRRADDVLRPQLLGHRARSHGEPLPGGGGRDRKSTRLNSSHVKNSYAVFCLKKKIRNRSRT